VNSIGSRWFGGESMDAWPVRRILRFQGLAHSGELSYLLVSGFRNSLAFSVRSYAESRVRGSHSLNQLAEIAYVVPRVGECAVDGFKSHRRERIQRFHSLEPFPLYSAIDLHSEFEV